MRALACAAAVFATITAAPAGAGRTYAGHTSQGRTIRLSRRGARIYGVTFGVQCAGTPATVRTRPAVLRSGRLRLTFSTGTLNGILRGQVGPRLAHGTLSAQGKECATGTVTWRAIGH